MTVSTEREMVADMVTAVLGQLETIALVHRQAAPDAAIAICKMLEVAPESWRRHLAELLRQLEAKGVAEIPGMYRHLVRRALGPPSDEPKGYVL